MTRHQAIIDGKTVKYTATVGWFILKDPKDKPIARFGYTAYTLDGVKNLTQRPITFAFNGGPGSSSIWLHMGIMGPRRVVVNDGGYAPPPPSQVVDNAFSPLDVTDIVMIDPVGTGFSKPLGDAKPADFHGVDEDIKSVGAVHQALRVRERALGLAQVRARRKLRRHARRGTRLLPAVAAWA